MTTTDFSSTFAKEGGRVGWGSPRTKYGGGALGSGQGGVARCAR
ncbi:hypothetical protein ACFOOM_19310 [Streptomyces echinoruber]|nr:hypothetical protein [Streptomyces echinoruber]